MEQERKNQSQKKSNVSNDPIREIIKGHLSSIYKWEELATSALLASIQNKQSELTQSEEERTQAIESVRKARLALQRNIDQVFSAHNDSAELALIINDYLTELNDLISIYQSALESQDVNTIASNIENTKKVLMAQLLGYHHGQIPLEEAVAIEWERLIATVRIRFNLSNIFQYERLATSAISASISNEQSNPTQSAKEITLAVHTIWKVRSILQRNIDQVFSGSNDSAGLALMINDYLTKWINLISIYQNAVKSQDVNTFTPIDLVRLQQNIDSTTLSIKALIPELLGYHHGQICPEGDIAIEWERLTGNPRKRGESSTNSDASNRGQPISHLPKPTPIISTSIPPIISKLNSAQTIWLSPVTVAPSTKRRRSSSMDSIGKGPTLTNINPNDLFLPPPIKQQDKNNAPLPQLYSSNSKVFAP